MNCRMTRRGFALLSLAALGRPASTKVDVAVIGGGTGGCAAALAALRAGRRVLLTEETVWIGGQLTSQAVPPDEHPWIESFGGTELYRRYRDGVRAYYRRHYPLTAEARAVAHLNPGNGSVSRITHEPRVSLAVLEAMLAPYLASGQLILWLRHRPVATETSGATISTVRLRALDTGAEQEVQARIFIDCTEQGDLLPLASVEFTTGAESRRDTGEPHAPEQAQPSNIQSFTVCFAMEHRPGEDHTIDRPAQYSFWRDYVPKLTPAWPGHLLAWHMSNPQTLERRELRFDPTLSISPEGPLNLWLYRRLLDAKNFAGGAFRDVSLVNWPQNDYWLGALHGVPEVDAEKHLEGGRQLSLSLLYWMQTAAPRPDGGQGWKGLRIRPDVTGTGDGLAQYPYIRESRRIVPEFLVTEAHIGTEARMAATGASRDDVRAESFSDSCGIGSYRIDLHPSTGGDNYIDISSLPFEIPLGALIPRGVENLLAGAKNIGVTHITNGCYRLHPVEWNIGESAGALAAWAIGANLTPREVRARRLNDFQRDLTKQGVELRWPRLSPR